jgi:hypothetical protein
MPPVPELPPEVPTPPVPGAPELPPVAVLPPVLVPPVPVPPVLVPPVLVPPEAGESLESPLDELQPQILQVQVRASAVSGNLARALNAIAIFLRKQRQRSAKDQEMRSLVTPNAAMESQP